MGLAGCSALLAACDKATRPAPVTSATPAVSVPPSPSVLPSSSPPPSVAPATLSSLSKGLSRPLVLPNSAGYAAAATLYNPRFDATSHPAAVAQCTSPADVAACVRYAAQTRTPLALRSGGHSYGGWSTGPGLVVDVGGLGSVTVDTAAATARIGAGARLEQVYAALAAKGVALAAGSCPTVGITGFALGGGIGALTRAYGLTCDALRSVQIVTADGNIREVNASTDPDLFWALAGGGGGSFGAVTALTVAVRPMPTITTFYLRWPWADAESVVSSWQKWIAGRDPRLWSTAKLLADPPTGLQATVSGTWIGPASGLAGELAPLKAAVGSAPATDQVSTLSYAQAMLYEAGCLGQSAAACVAAALVAPKRQPFAATSAILATALPTAGITAALNAVQAGLAVPKMVEGAISFDALGGQVANVAPSGTPIAFRAALATIQYTATWASIAAVAPAAFDSYVQQLRAALKPWTGNSAYVNYADPAIADYGNAYWGANYARLQSVKKQYDPSALFTFAQAVRP